MNILIKEIDQLTSKIHKDRVISEYIIYLQENGVNMSCVTVFGEENKNSKVEDILIRNFGLTIPPNVVKEISFEETINNLN